MTGKDLCTEGFGGVPGLEPSAGDLGTLNDSESSVDCASASELTCSIAKWIIILTNSLTFDSFAGGHTIDMLFKSS